MYGTGDVIKNIGYKSEIDKRLCDVYEYLKTSPIFIDSEKYMLSQDKMAIVGISKNYSSLLILGAFQYYVRWIPMKFQFCITYQ